VTYPPLGDGPTAREKWFFWMVLGACVVAMGLIAASVFFGWP